MQLLTRLHPYMRRRVTSAQRAMDEKIWRNEVERWNAEVKPASIKAHLRLQAIDPRELDVPKLLHHLETCYAHCEVARVTCISLCLQGNIF